MLIPLRLVQVVSYYRHTCAGKVLMSPMQGSVLART